jgi:hypothetical protein
MLLLARVKRIKYEIQVPWSGKINTKFNENASSDFVSGETELCCVGWRLLI